MEQEPSTFGQRAADAVSSAMGSWFFICAQSVFVAAWIGLNVTGFVRHWDPYSFTLLNLLFSTQAAYAAPIIMQSQNRQSEKDRQHAEQSYAHTDEILSLQHAQMPLFEQVLERLSFLEQQVLPPKEETHEPLV